MRTELMLCTRITCATWACTRTPACVCAWCHPTGIRVAARVGVRTYGKGADEAQAVEFDCFVIHLKDFARPRHELALARLHQEELHRTVADAEVGQHGDGARDFAWCPPAYGPRDAVQQVHAAVRHEINLESLLQTADAHEVQAICGHERWCEQGRSSREDHQTLPSARHTTHSQHITLGAQCL